MTSAPIDLEKIVHLLEGQSLTLDTLLRLFADDLQVHVLQLQTLSTEPPHWSSYHRLLHRLLGSAGYFGAENLRRHLLQAEQACQQCDESALTIALAQVYDEIVCILSCPEMFGQTP